MKPKYWICIIGPVDEKHLPLGADGPPRAAAREAMLEMTSQDPPCSSGWLTEKEYKKIDNARYDH